MVLPKPTYWSILILHKLASTNQINFPTVVLVPKEFTQKIVILHLLLFITRKYTITNAKLELIHTKIHSFY